MSDNVDEKLTTIEKTLQDFKKEKEKKQAHPVFSYEEEEQYLAQFGKKEDGLLVAFDKLLQEHSQETQKKLEFYVDKKLSVSALGAFDEKSKPIFNDILKDNINEIGEELDKLIKSYNSNDLTGDSFKENVIGLILSLSSEAVEEAKAFSSSELAQLHTNIVVPLKRAIEAGTEESISRGVGNYNNIILSLKNVSTALMEEIVRSRMEIVSLQKTTSRKISNLKVGKRLG